MINPLRARIAPRHKRVAFVYSLGLLFYSGIIGLNFSSQNAKAGVNVAAFNTSSVHKSQTLREKGNEDIVRIRLGGDSLQTRFVIEFEKRPSAKVLGSILNDTELVIGLNNITLKTPIKGEGRGLIQGWRVENAGGGVRLRLGFNSKSKVFRKFLLPPADGISTYRYVIDIVPSQSDPYTKAAFKTTSLVTSAPTIRGTVTGNGIFGVRTPSQKTIVIDAGHGGRDPGSSGSSAKEKVITLETAIALKASLERTGRYKVIMTRETDVYVDLAQRVRIARDANADLFISLHADSGSENSNVRGASIYTLSDSGSERAAKKALTKGDWSLNDAPSDKIINRILIDLSQRATKNRSAIFAQLVTDNIQRTTPLLKSSHRQAGFMVLLAPDVPAVLLEMGFLTNKQDERLLMDSNHRMALAADLSRAIDQYFINDVRYASFGIFSPKAP